jgi:hypothetical protein
VEYAAYRPFFVQERVLNRLVDEQVMQRRRLTHQTAQQLKQKILSKL